MRNHKLNPNIDLSVDDVFGYALENTFVYEGYEFSGDENGVTGFKMSGDNRANAILIKKNYIECYDSNNHKHIAGSRLRTPEIMQKILNKARTTDLSKDP